MRLSPALAVLLLAAAPAAAQAPQPSPAPRPEAEIAQRLADPRVADTLANAMQVLAKSLLNLPAGELQAISEGRKPSAAERRQTVRDVARRDDPNFDRKFADQMARTRPVVEQSMRALGQALPAVMSSLRQAGEALDRAAANMPDPTYPKR